MRHIIYLSLFFIGFFGVCQPNRLSTQLGLLDYSEDKVPAELFTSRSGVILRISDELSRKQWKKRSADFHSGFLQIGIDPVMYLFEQDLYANDKINESFVQLIRRRDIKNLIIISKNADRYEMVIASGLNQQRFFTRTEAWKAADIEPGTLLFKLGLIVKKSEFKFQNFLLLSEPTFVEDINFFKGSHLATYPGILRRQKLGVVIMDSLRIDNSLAEDKKAALIAYNQEVKRFNVTLEKLFEDYPYEWEMFSFKDNEYAIASGIQYVFQLAQTSGSGVKDFLNYPDHTKETQIISVTPGNLPGEVHLKRLPVEQVVYKGYIYQARTDDVFVGTEWDADPNWQSAVRNFFFTLQRHFEE